MTPGMKKLRDKTIEILQRDGWCQGYYHAPDGRHCFQGAIRQAAMENKQGSFTAEKFRTEVEVVLGMSVIRWNDHQGRKFSEVIELLESF